MARSVSAVVSFVESPSVGGSREWPLATIVDILNDADGDVPGLGLAPTKLLQSALRNVVLEQCSTDAISLEQWLSVRARSFS